MGLGIATKKPDRSRHPPGANRRRRRRRGGIAGIIFLANFAGVVILVLGSLLFNELRTGLTQAKADALRAQGSTIASVLAEAAVSPDAEPVLDANRARAILKRLFREPGARLRLYDRNRVAIADSAVLYDEISVRALPPIGPSAPNINAAAGKAVSNARIFIQGAVDNPEAALSEEVASALQGDSVARERFDEGGQRVVSVSVPIQRVRAVVGVLTLESGDVSDIVDAERRALYPFIITSILVTIISASLLAWSIAVPLRKLAEAADNVRRGRSPTLDASNLRGRPDEIGDLADALSVMTSSLRERIDANESFAADVAHEIKNPLAAIRNAAELLPRATSAESKAKLESIILADARRVDRLVTDIANASRLDAELARASKSRFSLADMIDDMVRVYASIGHARHVEVQAHHHDEIDRLNLIGREEAISRVLTNLLDNGLSFSPEGGAVTIITRRNTGRIQIVVQDDGPGIPDEAIESIFKRFYTHRPTTRDGEGRADFGKHSGLGLAIARQIAEAHNGTLIAQNRTDSHGARFIFEVPGI
jgi:two-component system sensor histidine kinase ChvG